MKILFIAQRFHTNLYYRVRSLQEAGHRVDMLVMYKQHSEDYETLEPKVLKRSFFDKIVKAVKGKSDLWKTKMQVPSFWQLGAEIRRSKANYLVVKNLQSFLSVYSLIWATILRKKTFLLIQTDKYRVQGRAKKVLVWILKNVCNVQKVISPLKDKSGISDPFFEHIPFVYDVQEIEKEHFKSDRINIIDIGKFYKRKDHISLLKAVNTLKDKYKIRLTIIGEKADIRTEDEIYQYVDRHDLGDMVDVLVNVSYKQVLEMYKDFDLFVLPSYDEPAAYSIVEAMANGLPVIASDTCGTKCYIEEGTNGHVFKSKDADDLAEKIERTIQDRHELIKMGKRSYSKATEDHSMMFFSNKLEQLIK